jgi:hypothetical protein
MPPDSDADPIAKMLGPRLRQSLKEMQAWVPETPGRPGDIPGH